MPQPPVYTKRLWGPVTNPVANVEVLVATVPTGKVWVVTCMVWTFVGSGNAFNRLSLDGGTTFIRWLERSGGTVGLSDTRTVRLALNAGEKVYHRSDTAGTIYTHATGFEFDV